MAVTGGRTSVRRFFIEVVILTLITLRVVHKTANVTDTGIEYLKFQRLVLIPIPIREL